MFAGQDNNFGSLQSGGGMTQNTPMAGVNNFANGSSLPPSANGPMGGQNISVSSSSTDQSQNNGTGNAPADPLLELKQQALQQLTPLVSHLEQTPLEKFRTTMMLIQASDNQALLQEAYEAAQKIPDDKVRAQALLDVVNEINYFTQASSSQG